MSSLLSTAERADRAVDRLESAGVDVMLVTDLVNVRYLTGYTGSNGIALIGPGLRRFVTDFRYVERAAAEVEPSFERMRASEDLLGAVPDALEEGSLRLGFEEAHLTVLQHTRLRQLLAGRANLVGVRGLVEGLRMVKDEEEIDRIRQAAVLADTAFDEEMGRGLAGRTEREVALSLEATMRRLGAEHPSFESIVAAGAYGALPHAIPRDVEIPPDQLVVIDWGARLDGYCSDCTRTVATGEIGEQARDIYALVLDAQLAGLAALTPGARSQAVDRAARERIEAAGQGEHFGHNLGHGVGLDIHEDPRLSRQSEAVLEAGNVVTVEPGVYLPV